MLPAASPTAGASPVPKPRDPVAVLALNDSGINPYHQAFRDCSARAQCHPSTYIPGYPRSAKPLRLTLDAPDWGRAALADCKIWDGVKPGKLYWVPGTRIVGAVAFGVPFDSEVCNEPLILDVHGHGTMTASRAAGAGHGACPECSIVSVQMNFSDIATSGKVAIDALEWQARNAH